MQNCYLHCICQARHIMLFKRIFSFKRNFKPLNCFHLGEVNFPLQMQNKNHKLNLNNNIDNKNRNLFVQIIFRNINAGLIYLVTSFLKSYYPNISGRYKIFDKMCVYICNITTRILNTLAAQHNLTACATDTANTIIHVNMKHNPL